MAEGKLAPREHDSAKICDFCYSCVQRCCLDRIECYGFLPRDDCESRILFCGLDCQRAWLVRQKRLGTKLDQLVDLSTKFRVRHEEAKAA